MAKKRVPAAIAKARKAFVTVAKRYKKTKRFRAGGEDSRKPRRTRKQKTAKRTVRRTGGSSPRPFVMPEGVTAMNGRKRKTRKSSRRRYGFEGFEGKRKRRTRRRSTRAYGFEGRKRSRRSVRRYGFDKKDIMSILMSAGGAVAGGIGSSYVVNMIPNLSPKVKAALPLVGGVALSMTRMASKPLVKSLALGMMVTGGLALVRQFMPTLPLLAGEDEVTGQALLPGSEDDAMLGLGAPLVAGEEWSQSVAGMGEEFATSANAY